MLLGVFFLRLVLFFVVGNRGNSRLDQEDDCSAGDQHSVSQLLTVAKTRKYPR